MKKLFEGGTKGRLFNNPAKGGKGEWEMKKGIVCVVAMIGALVLVGWGCGNGYGVSNTNGGDGGDNAITTTQGEATLPPTINWHTYRNDTHGVEFKYPDGWERRENETGTEVSESVSFDVENVENDNPITFTISAGVNSSEDDVREFASQGFDVVEVTTVIVNGVEWRKTIIKDRETPLQFVSYVTEREGKSYAFFSNYSGESPDGSLNQRNIDTLAGMLGSFQFVE